MILIALDMPTEPVELRQWLERQLVGLDLHQLVDELAVIHGPQTTNPSLEEALGTELPVVLNGGLSQLPTPPLRTLLTHPQLLFELQERAFIDGGEHWNRVPRGPELSAAVERVQERIFQSDRIGSTPQTPPRSQSSPARPQPNSRRALIWLIPIATAAGIALFLLRPSVPDWGWEKPGVLTAGRTAAEHYLALEQAAGEFDRVTLNRPADLERRLREFRHACDALIEAPHATLSASGRQQLVDRCRLWAKKIDGHVADLKSGEKSIDQVRLDAQATVEALRRFLRDEAAKAAA